MVNYNGALLKKDSCKLSLENRGFKYGDSLFETICIKRGKILFIEDHYFRLLASMRMLRMKIPMIFTLDYLKIQILNLLESTNSQNISKVRFTVFRKEGGLYKPTTNEIDFLIEVFEGKTLKKDNYKIDLFKEYYVNSGLLSTIKSSNKLIHVLSSIYADENELDNCILLNEQKKIVEASNANIFLVKENKVSTPKLLDGCINGISRKKIIEIIEKHSEYTLEETSISPFELQKAEELFLTNIIIGVQPVTNYKKKKFSTKISNKFANLFKNLSDI